MERSRVNVLLFVVIALIVIDITGIVLPFWYKKDGYRHNVKKQTTVHKTPLETAAPTSGIMTNNRKPTADQLYQGDTWTAKNVNRTKTITVELMISSRSHGVDTFTNSSNTRANTLKDEQAPIMNMEFQEPDCVITMGIHEGLWNRYCYKYSQSDCAPDVQELCNGMGYPQFNKYVVCNEIAGVLMLIVVIIVVTRSKLNRKQIDIEMIGAKIGVAGLLMIVGALVYAAEDGGKIGYQSTDLHAGWALCTGAGLFAMTTCVYCMYKGIKAKSRLVKHYFPINNDSYNFNHNETVEV